MVRWRGARAKEVVSRKDSIGQLVEKGDLVAYNLSGSIAIGRVEGVYDYGGYDSPAFMIELLDGPGAEYMLRGKDKHVSKVKNYNGVMKITGVPKGEYV